MKILTHMIPFTFATNDALISSPYLSLRRKVLLRVAPRATLSADTCQHLQKNFRRNPTVRVSRQIVESGNRNWFFGPAVCGRGGGIVCIFWFAEMDDNSVSSHHEQNSSDVEQSAGNSFLHSIKKTFRSSPFANCTREAFLWGIATGTAMGMWVYCECGIESSRVGSTREWECCNITTWTYFIDAMHCRYNFFFISKNIRGTSIDIATEWVLL